jgi:hypothetical protein
LLTKSKYILVLLVLITAGFIYGLVQLLSLRFESGDVYPAYSSLRSDPLGTRALFDGLNRLNPSNIQRNYLPLSRVNFKEPTTLLYLGSDHRDLKFVTKEFSEAIDRMTDAGGRLVMSFQPVRWKAGKKASNDEPSACREEIRQPIDPEPDPASDKTQTAETGEGGTDSKKSQGKQAVDQPDECLTPYCKKVAIDDHWGVSFNYDRTEQEQSYARVDSGTDTGGLPNAISWHTDLIFEKLDSVWEVLYFHDDHPVIIERPFKSGSILLVADSYLLSNEALRAERHSALLTRVIGSNSLVVFDESHFGIYKIPGIAGLIRTHGLQWFFCGLVLIFVLFVWKNSIHFVPPTDDISGGTAPESNQGRDVFQGLVSLLRRNIATRDILRVGMNEWKKSFDVEERLRSDQLAKIVDVIDMEQTISENKVNPVSGYITISRILSEGKDHE